MLQTTRYKAEYSCRPERAKALKVNAFALSGRQLLPYIKTQGVALGYVLVGLSGRHNDYKLKISVMQISILTPPPDFQEILKISQITSLRSVGLRQVSG